MTLEAWVNPRSLAAWRAVLMKEAPPGDYAYAMYATNSIGNPGGYAGNGNLPATSPLQANAWSHIAFTNDGISSYFYVNGDLVAAGPSNTVPSTTGVLRIGGDGIWPNEFFNGLIDEVRVYDKALTQPEIQQDMTTPVTPVNGDTAPPTVSVTAPAGGATVSGGVQVQANASDDVGVASVQFRVDGNDIGSPDTGAPYAATWDTTTVSNGTHMLTAVARDAAGNTTTSSEVSVTVSNSSPSNNPVLALGFEEGSGGTTADSSGTGNNGSVQGATWTTGKYGGALSFDGVNDFVQVADAASLDITRDITLEVWAKPHSLGNWKALLMKEAPPGDYSYAMYATNSVGLPGGYAGPGNLPAPTPLANNAWSHIAFTNDATASKLYVNGNLVASGPPQTMPVSAGALKIGGDAIWPGEFFDGLIDEVRVYNKSLTPAQITSDMNTAINNTPPPPDTTKPTVGVTAPANGATVSGTSVALSANASDNVGVTGVQFKIDNNSLGAADTSSPFGATWDSTAVGNGNHTVTAVASDAAGNTETTSVTVNVQNTPPDTTNPTVSMTAPANGATVSGASVAVSANASDNVGVTSVQFKLDNNDLGSADTSSPYGVTWNSTTANNGTHTLTAVARDAAGNTQTATAVSVSVNNVSTGVAPVLALGFNDGSGTTARDASAVGQQRDAVGPDVEHDRRQVRRRAVLRRRQRLGHRGRCQLARPHDRDDPRGVGQAQDGGDVRRGDGQGDDRRRRLRPLRDEQRQAAPRRDGRRRRQRAQRHAGGQRVDAPCRDVRRLRGAALRQRHAGRRPHRRPGVTRLHRRAAHRRRQHLARGVVRRADRRGPRLQPRADRGRHHGRHEHGDRFRGHRRAALHELEDQEQGREEAQARGQEARAPVQAVQADEEEQELQAAGALLVEVRRRGLAARAGVVACLALLAAPSAVHAQAAAAGAEAGVGLLALEVRTDTPRTAPPAKSSEAPARLPEEPEAPPRSAAIGLSASLRYLQGDDLVSEISDLRAAGVRYSREDMDWDAIEPEPGRFNWSRWDGLVRASAQQGLRLIAIPGGSPAWATGPVGSPPVSDTASVAYARFVRAAIERYGTRGTFWAMNPHLPRVPITMWDVWNEPYDPGGWGGPPDPAGYARMYRRVVQESRDADPSARFLLEADTGANGSGWPQPPFLEAMLASDAGLVRDIDIVSVHPYSGKLSPETCTPDRRPPGGEFWQPTRFDFCRVLDIRRILDANGAKDARIWITEVGWSTAPQGERSVSEAEQADYVRKTFDLLRRWRVVDGVVFYHYQLPETDPTNDLDWYGLVRSDGSPKPAWYAFTDELRKGLSTAR